MSTIEPNVYEIKDDDPIIKAMERLLEPMRSDIKDILHSHKEMKSEFLEITRLKEENINLIRRVKAAEESNELLSKRVCALEDRLLQNNIIIHGIREGPWETEEIRQEKLYHAFSETVMGKSIEDRMDTARTMYITSSRRIGKFHQMSSRPISVEMLYKNDVEYLLRNRRYLSEGIFIDREYSRETESARRLLRPYLKAAQKIPTYQRKCRLEGDTLILKGLSYTMNTLHKLPDELSASNISSISDKNTFGFFGSINPLSNFYPTKFEFNGNIFHSSEQYIQYTKAKHFGDDECARNILSTKNALECKELAKGITGFDYMRWKEHAKSLCKEGICAKFMSSTLLQNKLLDTGNKTIVECCWDKMWGTGDPLHVDNCLDKGQWASQGILGEVLQEIRTKLKNSTTCPPTVETPADSVRQASIDVPEYDSLNNSIPEQQIMETG